MKDSVELVHSGVIGMRWGRRKSGGSSSSSKKRQDSDVKKTELSDHARARALNSKGLKNLSNDELKVLTQRMDLERKYSNINPSKVKQGHKIVKGLVAAGTMATSIYAFKNTELGKDVYKKVAPKKFAAAAAKAAASKVTP
jgi:hypothetical protein